MHQSHNIPWHILASNIRYVHDDNRVTPPYTGLRLLDRPTQSGELNHFTRKFVSAIHTFALTERQKYPPAQEFRTPPDDELVFSAELMAKYPDYLNENNQKLENWIHPRYLTTSQRRNDWSDDLVRAVGILLHENQMHTLLMLANHPLIHLRTLDCFGYQLLDGSDTVAHEALVACLLWNFVDAAGYLLSGAYKDMMKSIIFLDRRYMWFFGFPHRGFYGRTINTDPAVFDSDKQTEGEVPELCNAEGAEKLQAYLKRLFELLYRYEVLVTECGVDRGPDWQNKIVNAFWFLHIHWPGHGVTEVV